MAQTTGEIAGDKRLSAPDPFPAQIVHRARNALAQDRRHVVDLLARDDQRRDMTHILISGLTSRASSRQCVSIPLGSSIRLAYEPEALLSMAD